MNVSRTVIRICAAASILGGAAIAQELPKPTAEHAILAADAGTWDATIKAYTGGPEAEPTVSKGSEVNTLLPGGLWLLSKFEGDFGGVKFEGHGQFGYDPLKKKYVGSWVDSINPALSVLEGTYDAKSKTMTYVSDGVDAASGAKYTQKMVTVASDDDTRTFTLSMKFQGSSEEIKLMEVTYTRRK